MKLTKSSVKKVYGKITLLDINEEPIQSIEGAVISGNINIDGKSAIRRTCSLNLIAESFVLETAHWGTNRKFYLEIGLENTINNKYPNLVWFP